MGLSEFLEKLPEDTGAPLSFAALSELTGLSSAEADELARTWEEWPVGRIRELFRRLSSLTEEDTSFEFEVILKTGLSAADPEVRTTAIGGLAESTDRTLAARFAAALERDPDAHVRAAAAAGMATLCDLAAEGKLHRLDAEKMRLALLKALENPKEPPEVHRRALETVSVFSGDRVSALIQGAYGSPDESLRQSALYAMGRTSDPRWMKNVLAELDAVSPALRYEAATALGKLGGDEDAVRLKGPLDDPDLDVQLAAVAALERLGGEGARRLLKQALNGPEPSVQEAAREALDALGAEEGLAAVVGPEMRRRGDLFGGPARAEAFGDAGGDEGYDAAAREGWGHNGEGQDLTARNGHGAQDLEDE